MAYVSNDELFPVWQEPRSFWERTGLTPAQQRRLDVALVALVLVLLSGWVYTVVLSLGRGESPQVARQLGGSPISPISPEAAPPAAFLLDAALRQFVEVPDVRGESGALRVVIQEPGDSALALPDSLPTGVEVAYGTESGTPVSDRPPPKPGIWNILLRARGAVRQVPQLMVITQVPMSAKREGRIGNFRIGDWPFEGGRKPPRPIYTTPRGMIEVTPENQNLYLSEHIQLRDFITKGQDNVWPKYVVVQPRILDKIELVIQELERMGHPVENIFAVSGFRTPWYNAGGGNTQGRGQLSRHMYGDAMDIAVDNDGNGLMDDLNGDGRVTLSDARVIGQAVDRVEQKYPHLVGGMHYYPPTGGHRGMVHIDTRGYRARW